MKKIPTKKDQKEIKEIRMADALYKAIVKYLEYIGYKVVVIGGISIRQNGMYKFSIEIDFTGSKKGGDTP